MHSYLATLSLTLCSFTRYLRTSSRISYEKILEWSGIKLDGTHDTHPVMYAGICSRFKNSCPDCGLHYAFNHEISVLEMQSYVVSDHIWHVTIHCSCTVIM